jgi:hypothetical protein
MKLFLIALSAAAFSFYYCQASSAQTDSWPTREDIRINCISTQYSKFRSQGFTVVESRVMAINYCIEVERRIH